jgi:hypothetical protein
MQEPRVKQQAMRRHREANLRGYQPGEASEVRGLRKGKIDEPVQLLAGDRAADAREPHGECDDHGLACGPEARSLFDQERHPGVVTLQAQADGGALRRCIAASEFECAEQVRGGHDGEPEVPVGRDPHLQPEMEAETRLVRELAGTHDQAFERRERQERRGLGQLRSR